MGRQEEKTMTKYQELKNRLGLNGGGWGANSRKCSNCNGGTRLAAGKKNILITACEHDLVAVRQAIEFAEVSATFTAFSVKTPDQMAHGAWNGGEFKIAKEVR